VTGAKVTQGEEQEEEQEEETPLGTNDPPPTRRGFSWVMLWTILGAVVPGTGLIVAGRRWIGSALLGLLALAAAALAGLAFFGNPLKKSISLAVSPRQLLTLAIVAVVVALLWVAVIVLTNTQLRRSANLSRGQSVFSWLIVAALVVGVGLPAYEISNYALIQRGIVTSDSVFQGNVDNTGIRPNTTKADPWAGQPRVNVLLIGSDAGEDRIGVRPDTMILASIDTKTGNTVLFSLPRSLQRARFAPGSPGARAWPRGYWCPNEQCLLNAVWTWAEDYPGYAKKKHPGLTATEDAVEGVTGLHVDNYVMLNLQGFRDFVDAIGGITVDVHKRLPIGGDGNPASPIYHKATGGWIEVGNNQHLSGYRALWFARSRWMYDDYDRMQRQRCVIGDVVNQADPVTLALNFPKIAKTLKKNLSTGIRTSELQAWVDLSQRIKGGTVKSLPFTDKVINTVHPNIRAIHRLVSEAITASVSPTSTSTASPKPLPSTVPSTGSSASPTKVKKKKKAKEPTFAQAEDVNKVC
jgi:LCP family protein required for cell wall assembly